MERDTKKKRMMEKLEKKQKEDTSPDWNKTQRALCDLPVKFPRKARPWPREDKICTEKTII